MLQLVWTILRQIDYLNVYYKWKTVPKDLKKSSDAVDKRVVKKCV